MAATNKEFLRRKYREESTDQLIDDFNKDYMSEIARDAIQGVLSERGISIDKYIKTPIETSKLKLDALRHSEQEISSRGDRISLFVFALPMAFLLEIFYPIFLAAISVLLQIELRCTASIHGTRDVACDFMQLVSDTFMTAILWNFFSLGGYTAIVYLLLAGMFFLVSEFKAKSFSSVYIGILFGIILALIEKGRSEAYLGSIIFCIVLAYFCRYWAMRIKIPPL